VEAFAEYTVSPDVVAYSSLTWMERKHEFEDFSTYDSGVPELSGTLGVKYSPHSKSDLKHWFNLYVRAESKADETEEDGKEHHNDGWGTVNLEVGADYQNYRLLLSLANLTDKKYSTSMENLWAAERSVQVKLIANF